MAFAFGVANGLILEVEAFGSAGRRSSSGYGDSYQGYHAIRTAQQQKKKAYCDFVPAKQDCRYSARDGFARFRSGL